MASAQSKIFNLFLRLINKKSLLKRQFTRGNFNSFAAPVPPSVIFKTCNVIHAQIDGRNVFELRPMSSRSQKHILYLHGGAYVASFTKLHWNFLAGLVRETNCSITAPDYPLAPSHTYKEVFDMMLKLYQKLLITVPPGDLIFMGDSAGGGLALALAQKIKAEKLPQPSQIILLSPWLDVTLTNPDIASIDRSDPFTGIEGLRLAGKAYVGRGDASDYLISPINGPLEGLGKISVFVGTREILVADTRKLKERLDALAIALNYYEYKDMIHVWMLLHFPESKKAKKEIMKLINS